MYTDEDKIDRAGRHGAPLFKPDWSPERMRTQMYTCHLSVLRRAAGRGGRRLRPGVRGLPGLGPRPEGDRAGAAGWIHIPRVLYHWRTLETSAAGGGEEAKPWAFEAGTRAIQAHCDRIGLPAEADRASTRRRLPPAPEARPDEPKVSIVIPTCRAPCGKSATSRSSWSSTACVAWSRNQPTRTTRSSASPTPATEEGVLEELRRDRRRAAADRRLRPAVQFLGQDQPRCRSAATASSSCCWNDDMEVVTPDWIERLTMYAQMPEVGAVGGACSGRTGASSTPGSCSRTAATQATSTAASRGTSTATRTTCSSPRTTWR